MHNFNDNISQNETHILYAKYCISKEWFTQLQSFQMESQF